VQKNAGKRLCTPAEWRSACGGERGWEIPVRRRVRRWQVQRVSRGAPAVALHDNAAIGHTDPRLNRVKINGKPLLRKTGDTPDCASVWGDDAIYDMVGNLDEWMESRNGHVRRRILLARHQGRLRLGAPRTTRKSTPTTRRASAAAPTCPAAEPSPRVVFREGIRRSWPPKMCTSHAHVFGA